MKYFTLIIFLSLFIRCNSKINKNIDNTKVVVVEKKIEKLPAPTIKTNNFDVCYTCVTKDEINTFENKRGSTLLKIDVKKDILFFYEFGLLDDYLTDTMTNQEYDNFLFHQGKDYQYDTFGRETIDPNFLIYYYKDSISNFKQITLYYGANINNNDFHSIRSFIYLNNKIFNLYTNQQKILNNKLEYVSNLKYLSETFYDKLKSKPSDYFDSAIVSNTGVISLDYLFGYESNYLSFIPKIKNKKYNDTYLYNDLYKKINIHIENFPSATNRIYKLNEEVRFNCNSHKYLEADDYYLEISRGLLDYKKFHKPDLYKDLPIVYY